MTGNILNRRALLQGTGLSVAAALAGCATPSRPPKGDDDARDMSVAALALVNALRTKNGLPAVSPDAAASEAAIYQARRMASAGTMAHLIGPGDDFKSRMKDGGVALPAAENVAAGQRSLEDAMAAWIDSPKHLKNMLGAYRGLGVAVALDASNGDRPYWAMVLSNPD